MESRLSDLRNRELIDVAEGCRFGCVEDVEVDWEQGKILSLVVPGRLRFFGLLGREEDIIIPVEAVKRFGEDLILVDSGRISKHDRSRVGKPLKKHR